MPKYQRRKIKEQIAVIYARFSCDKQRDESIEDQLRVCMEYAREHGIKVVDQYCDYALSGRNDHRPQFQKMIADSASGDFNAVLVYKTDRFARNRWDSAIYKKQLYLNGVKVISATELIPEGGGGIIMESFYESFAELYSVQISQNVRRAARGNAIKNKSNGGITLFCYKVNPVTRQYELDETAAPIVAEIFNRAASGKPVNTILTWLRSIGLNFTWCRIYTMLHNERYTGTYIYGDIRNEGGMPAIVSKEKFDIVQEISKNRKQKHRHANQNYLFSKRCFCGKCGSTVTGESSKKNIANGYRYYYYYSCQNHKLHHTCDKKRMRADIVEKAACRALAELLTQPDLITHFINAALKYQQSIKQENLEIQIVKKHLEEAQTRKSNLLAAIEQGIFTSSTASRLQELEDKEAELQNKIKNLSLQNSFDKFSTEQIEYFLLQFKNEKVKSEMFVKSIFQELISKIFLFDDHITLVYDLKNNPSASVTFDDILQAENAESRINTGFRAIKKGSNQWFEPCSDWLAGCYIAQQRAFARAVNADNSYFVAFFYIKTDIFKQSSYAIAMAQIFCT